MGILHEVKQEDDSFGFLNKKQRRDANDLSAVNLSIVFLDIFRYLQFLSALTLANIILSHGSYQVIILVGLGIIFLIYNSMRT